MNADEKEVANDMTFKEFMSRVRKLKSSIKKQNLKTSDPRFTKMLVECDNLIEWKAYLDLKSYFYEIFNEVTRTFQPGSKPKAFRRKRPVYKVDIKTKRIIWSYPSCAAAALDTAHHASKGNHIRAAANAYKNSGEMHFAYGYYWIFVEDEKWDV